MKTFTIEMSETVTYEFPVEAENEDEARELAADVFCQFDDLNPYFVEVTDRNITEIVEATQ